jgi:hypothetical protein
LVHRREVAIRLRAVDGLAALASRVPEAGSTLEDALGHPDVAVRKMATFALVRLAGERGGGLDEIARRLPEQDRWMMTVTAPDIARSPELNARPPEVRPPARVDPAPRPHGKEALE